MDSFYQVTVIFCTYNPDYQKLISTLKSIITQKNIKLQIIVADDGSVKNYKKEIISFFQKHSYFNYEFSNNDLNVGTVNNIYKAILKAKGEYTYVISPGDFFFSENTLSGIYEFSKKNNIEIAFGKSQYYVNGKDGVKLIKQMNPSSPSIYNCKMISNDMKSLAYCTTQGIVGASFFRRTSTFREYLNIIKDLSKYDEDNASTYIHLLLRQKKIFYYDKYVVWYEYGSGISTANNDYFLEKLEIDCSKVLVYINEQKKQKIIDYILAKNKKNKKFMFLTLKLYFIRILGKLLLYKNYLTSTTSYFDEIIK